MARATTKEALIGAATKNFEKLWQTIDSLSVDAVNRDFDFSDDPKKKEAHWSRDKNLRDILVHLYEWHQLLIRWIRSNMKGQKAPFLPEPYNWKTYGDMNVGFWKKHQKTGFEESVKMLKESHAEVLELIAPFSDEQLFTKKCFDWTGTTTLGSYCISAMPSHYDWAVKKLKAHSRKMQKK